MLRWNQPRRSRENRLALLPTWQCGWWLRGTIESWKSPVEIPAIAHSGRLPVHHRATGFILGHRHY